MKIYRQELLSHRKFTIIWTSSLILLLSMYLLMYITVSNDRDAFIEAMASFPEEIRSSMGMYIENFTTYLGYYVFALTFTNLCAAIQGMYLGVAIISKEVREKTADFLMTKPISRIRIMTEKLLAAITILVVTNIVLIIVSYIMSNIVKSEDMDIGKFLLMSFTILFIQIQFFVVGLFISVILPKVKAVLPVSLGVVFGLYGVASFIANDKDYITRYLSPFEYFDPNYIYTNGKFETPFLITGIIVVIIGIISCYIIFIKKDIHAV